MKETRLTSKGQIVLPKELRDRLNWRPGQRFAVETDEEVVVLRPLSTDIDALIDDIAGCLPGDPISNLESEHRQEIARDERRSRGGR